MKKQFTPSLAFLLCLLLGWQVSQAGHFYVSTLSGNAAGSLEWALTQVNADNSSTIANPHVIDICVGGDVSLNPFPTKNCVINCPKDMSLKIYSIYCYQGSSGVRIIVNNAVIDNGPSSSFGGAVFGGCGSTLMLNNCYIANNTNQHQGAVFSNGDSIFLNGCTFYNNITTDGGGEGGGAAFNNGGYMRITNCTFSKNRSASTSASGAGGAVKNHAGGRMDIINCTFYNNRAESRGGALQNAPGATCRISNCIFVGNTAAGSGQDLWGEFQSLDGHNLFSDTAGAVLNGVVTGNIYGASTLSVLDTTLRDNGHYMLTHALVAGSPAINGAEPSVAGLFDQREYLRNGTADMGSFEYNGTNPCAGFSVAIDAPLPDCLPVLNNLGFVITGGTAPYSSNWYNVTGSWLCGDSLQHFGNGEFIATVFDTAHCVAKDTIVLDYTLPEIDYTFSICGGDSVTVNGITYYLAGNYTQNYNCDSVIEISIDYGSEPVIERNYTICSGQSVNVGTNTYTAAGTYTDFFACDSVLITNLNILPLPALPVYSIDGVVCHDDTGSIQLATASPMQLTLGNNSYFFGPDTVWADFVIAYSSQYSSSGWSAQQLLGPPNTYPSYGDISTAWTANDYGNNRDFLVVGYSTPVTTNQVLIYETNAPGYIDTVYVHETSGNWLTVYTGTAVAGPPVSTIFSVTLPSTISVDAVRWAIATDEANNWVEYDAVGLIKFKNDTVSFPIQAGVTYPVNLSANGCTVSNSITIPNPLVSLAVTTADDTLCLGEATTIAASGSVTYSWSNNITSASQSVSPATTSIYTITAIDARGCIETDSVTITVSQLAVNITTGNDSICAGQSVTLSGNGAALYNWSNGSTDASQVLTPATSTTYSVTGTDAASCTATASVAITVQENLLDITTSIDSVCLGQTATLTATGSNSYVWSNTATGAVLSVTPVVTTTYAVTATDLLGCVTTDSAIITIHNPIPLLAVTTTDDSICAGQSATLAATGSVSYLWSNDSTSATQLVTPTATTTYIVVATDAQGCLAADSVTITVEVCAGINQTGNYNLSVQLYPNPATDVLMIQSDVTVLGVEVFDMAGKKLLADNTRTNRININSLAQGTYVLAIITDNGVVRKPFIKN